MTEPCRNCSVLENRILELRSELIDIETRRSQERLRSVTTEQARFIENSSDNAPDVVPRQDFIDLLELVKRIVENPSGESLEAIKSQLQKYIVCVGSRAQYSNE